MTYNGRTMARSLKNAGVTAGKFNNPITRQGVGESGAIDITGE